MLSGCVSRNNEALRDLRQSVARFDKHLCNNKRGFRQDPTCGAPWMEGKDEAMPAGWEQEDEQRQTPPCRVRAQRDLVVSLAIRPFLREKNTVTGTP